jgi:hypothetical protein
LNEPRAAMRLSTDRDFVSAAKHIGFKHWHGL